MTKKQFIDLIIHRLAGGNVSSDQIGRFDRRIVAKNASIAMDSMFMELFRNNESLLDLYAKDYDVTLTDDAILNLSYAQLPKKIVQLPGNAAIRLISARQDQTFFIPLVDSRAQGVFACLDVSRLDDTMYGFMTGERIYFKNKRVDIDDVIIKLIRPLDDYAWTDNVYLPSGKGFEIANLVDQLMERMPKEDMRNDNNTVVE